MKNQKCASRPQPMPLFPHHFPNCSLPSSPHLLFFMFCSWNTVVQAGRAHSPLLTPFNSLLKGYSEKVGFCVWVVTLKCISHRWIGRWDVCSAYWIYPDRSVTAHTRHPLCAHLWRACSVLCIVKCSPGLFFFVPAGAVGLLRITIAALLPLWQGAVWNSSCQGTVSWFVHHWCPSESPSPKSPSDGLCTLQD